MFAMNLSTIMDRVTQAQIKDAKARGVFDAKFSRRAEQERAAIEAGLRLIATGRPYHDTSSKAQWGSLVRDFNYMRMMGMSGVSQMGVRS